MKAVTRKEFLYSVFVAVIPWKIKPSVKVMTVNGAIPIGKLGLSLIHEHVLVDFIGADKISNSAWKREEVIKKVLPYLLEAKKAGVNSFFDCTPAFLGRDVLLLLQLSKESGMNLITNTGYYGAVNNKYLPPFAFTASAEQLASAWIAEYSNGIEGTRIKPGFIKTAVDNEVPLSDLHKKLVHAAAITHLKTGLTIFSHTGPAKPAFEQLDILQARGVHPSAFVWVHAQAEKNKKEYLRAAEIGCWISLDGIGWGDIDNYVDSLLMIKAAGMLRHVLISHDAGWYKPMEPHAEFKGFTNIFNNLIPALKKNGFTANDINLLLLKNPAEAMGIRVRRMHDSR